MACYVDTVRDYADRGLRFASYCHLLADTREELHALAAAVGMPRIAFQDHPWRWHYDLPAPLRPLAIEHGALEVDLHQVGALLKQRRTITLHARHAPHPRHPYPTPPSCPPPATPGPT